MIAAVVSLTPPRPNLKGSSQSGKKNSRQLTLFHLTSVYMLCWADFSSPLHTGRGLKSDCVGTLMRLSLDKALAVGNQLEVEAISEYEPLWTVSSLVRHSDLTLVVFASALQMAPSLLRWRPAWQLSVDTAWSLTRGETPESTHLWWAAMWTIKCVELFFMLIVQSLLMGMILIYQSRLYKPNLQLVFPLLWFKLILGFKQLANCCQTFYRCWWHFLFVPFLLIYRMMKHLMSGWDSKCTTMRILPMRSVMMWLRRAATLAGLPERFSVKGTTWKYVALYRGFKRPVNEMAFSPVPHSVAGSSFHGMIVMFLTVNCTNVTGSLNLSFSLGITPHG